jgi:hypothetical protein
MKRGVVVMNDYSKRHIDNEMVLVQNDSVGICKVKIINQSDLFIKGLVLNGVKENQIVKLSKKDIVCLVDKRSK